MRRSFILIGLAVSLIVYFSSVSTVMARIENVEGMAVEDDFQIAPVQVDVEVYPGDVIKQEIQVDNRLGKDQDFLITVEDFHSPSNSPALNGNSQDSGRAMYGAKDWIKNGLTRFRIAQGERQFFNIEIAVPEDVEVGEYYANVFVSALPGDSQTDLDTRIPNIKIVDRVGVNVIIRVRGFAKKEGLLNAFKVKKQWQADLREYDWLARYPVSFLVEFKNSGVERLRPYGVIEIANIFGRKIDTVAVKPFNVLRTSTREMEYNWEKNWFLGGFYTATLKLQRDDDGQNTDIAKVSFWVVPWKEIFVMLGLFVIIYKIRLLLFKKKRMKRLRNDEVQVSMGMIRRKKTYFDMRTTKNKVIHSIEDNKK